MATLYTQAASNVRRTWALMTIFFIFLIGVGWIFSRAYGNPAAFYGFALFAIVMNWVSYWHSAKIALAINRAQPTERSQFPELYNLVENLAITAGLPLPQIYLITDPAPNAFATGRDKDHAVIAVTSGLLQIMTKTELEGVLAHELSHIGNRDILLSTVVVTLVGIIAMLSDIFWRSMWWGGGRRGNDRDQAGGLFLILGLVAAILAPIAATLIQLAISRRREYLADASGALLTRYPEGLASALTKIGQFPAPLRRVSTSTAHLFIASPWGPQGQRKGRELVRPLAERLFSTHPPLADRIQILREMG